MSSPIPLDRAQWVAHSVRGGPSAGFPPDVPHGAGRLHLNEPAFPPSPRVIESIRQNADLAARYPDAGWTALRHDLAEHLNVAHDLILCGNGSDELLKLAGDAFLERGHSMINPLPSFPRYAMMSRLAGAHAINIAVRTDGACDTEAMLTACRPDTRMLIVATPNNPTGGMLTQDELRQLVSEVPDDIVLLIDEAYFEFAQQAGGIDALDTVRQRTGHWLVLRTFSKAYALAGLRVGYGIGSSVEGVEAMNRVRTTFNVNALAQIAAREALKDQEYMQAQVAQCATTRNALSNALGALGYPSLPSAANFIAVDVGQPATPVIQHLAGLGLYTGSLGPSHPTMIRIAVGTRADNDHLIQAFRQLPDCN